MLPLLAANVSRLLVIVQYALGCFTFDEKTNEDDIAISAVVCGAVSDVDTSETGSANNPKRPQTVPTLPSSLHFLSVPSVAAGKASSCGCLPSLFVFCVKSVSEGTKCCSTQQLT